MPIIPLEKQRAEVEAYAWRVIRELFAGIGWGLLGFFLTPLVVCPPFVDWLRSSAIGEVSPAHDLLTGTLRSYWGVVLVLGVGAVIQVRLIVMTVIRFVRNRPEETRLGNQLEDEFISLTHLSGYVPDRQRAELKKLLDQYNAAATGRAGGLFIHIALAVVVLAWYGLILFGDSVPPVPIAPQVHIPAVLAELERVESSQLETAEVWIHSKTSAAYLPGPWKGGYRNFVRKYHIVGTAPGDQWIDILVPDAMGFTPNPDRPLREGQSIPWNLENAQRYRVSYTPDFHLAVEITPIY